MKKIKKIAASLGVLGKILNLKTISNKDTYSCNYLNNKFDGSSPMGSIVVEDIECKNYIDSSNCWRGTSDGLTVTLNDKKHLILNGTTTSYVDIYCISALYNYKSRVKINEKLGTYCLSNNLTFENYIKTTSGYKPNTATITESDLLESVFIRVPAGKTFNNTELIVQLESGTVATKIVDHKDFSNSERNIITAVIPYNVPLNSTEDVILPLSEVNKIGDKFSVTSDKGILIGNGISMIKVSVACGYVSNTQGVKYLRIKNGTKQIALTYEILTSGALTRVLTIPTALLTVKGGDILYLIIQGASNDIVGGSGGNQVVESYITIEAVK